MAFFNQMDTLNTWNMFPKYSVAFYNRVKKCKMACCVIDKATSNAILLSKFKLYSVSYITHWCDHSIPICYLIQNPKAWLDTSDKRPNATPWVCLLFKASLFFYENPLFVQGHSFLHCRLNKNSVLVGGKQSFVVRKK